MQEICKWQRAPQTAVPHYFTNFHGWVATFLWTLMPRSHTTHLGTAHLPLDG